jgi:hypothetical protein
MFALLLMFTANTSACSDDDSGPGHPDASTDGGVDGGPDTDGEVDGGETSSFALYVADFTDSMDSSDVPLAGAVVALDKPGGERVEKTTGADGWVEFDGIDWSLGTAATTVYKENYVMRSVVNIRQEHVEEFNGELWMGLLPRNPETDIVQVEGTAENMVSNTNFLGVYSPNFKTQHQHKGPVWSLDVEPNTPFTLVGVEFDPEDEPVSDRGISQDLVQWVTVEHSGVSDATTLVELDFAASTDATHTVDGSFALPTRSESLLRTNTLGYVGVVNFNNSVFSSFFGFPRFSDISADENRFEYTLEWIEPSGATDVYTQYYVINNFEHYFSSIWVPGYPTAGQQDFTLLDLPRLIAPSDPSENHPLHEPLQWETFDEDLYALLFLNRGDGDIWKISTKDVGTGITVPQPPSTVDREAFLGTSRVGGALYFGHQDESLGHSDKVCAYTQMFLVP